MTGPDAPPPGAEAPGGRTNHVLAGPDQHTPPGTADAAPAGRARELAACPGCRDRDELLAELLDARAGLLRHAGRICELAGADVPEGPQPDGHLWRVSWVRPGWTTARPGRTRIFASEHGAEAAAARIRAVVRPGSDPEILVERCDRGPWRPL